MSTRPGLTPFGSPGTLTNPHMKHRAAAILPACLVRALLFTIAIGVTTADDSRAADEPAQPNARFGPYEAIVRDANIVHDVKVEEDGNVFLRLNPAFRDKELRVRISMQKGPPYRQWLNGEEELVSPAFAGKEPGGWTDRVKTTARYIEYWMDGELILHLFKRT